MPRVLVAEDEANIRELVRLHLGLEGWDVLEAADGDAALRQLRAGPVDLVVLDIMLPGLDGITVLRAMRRDGPNTQTPVLLLTARREESDKVLGLDSGADDYLTKPFGVRELVARARALMRRTRTAADSTTPGADQPVVTLGPVTLDPARRSATRDGRDIELTAREFDLLYLLAGHPGIVFSREALARARLEGRHTRHRAQRGHAGEAAAPQDRARPRDARAPAHGVGHRLQGRRCLSPGGIARSTGAWRSARSA